MKIKRVNEEYVPFKSGDELIDTRIEQATQDAQEVFWSEVASQYPEISTGDLPPDAAFAFGEACEKVVKIWVSGNKPTDGSITRTIKKHNLR